MRLTKKKPMLYLSRKFFLSFGLFLFSCVVLAKSWVHVSETYKGTYYVDYETIKRSENNTIMTHMIDYPKKQVSANGLPFSSELVIREYNCLGAESRLLEHNTYSGRKASGGIVYPRSWSSPWEKVVAGTLEETLWRIACGVVESDDNIITDYNRSRPNDVD